MPACRTLDQTGIKFPDRHWPTTAINLWTEATPS